MPEDTRGRKNTLIGGKKTFYGWYLAVACMFMLMCETGMICNTTSQYILPMTKALDISRGQYSLYISFASVGAVAVCFMIGKMYDKFNPHIITVAGGLAAVFAWIGMSFIHSLLPLYVLGVIMGAGSTFAGSVATSILISNWFIEKKGTALGLATMGSGIGSIIMNPLTSKLIISFGYQAALRITGLVGIICLIPIIMLYRYKPNEKGLVPMGADAPDVRGRIDRIQRDSTRNRKKEIMRKPGFYGICFIAFSLSGVAIGVLSQAQAYYIDLGYSAMKASIMVSLISFCIAFFKLAEGWINDRIGIGKTFCLVMSVAVLSMAMLSACRISVLDYAAAVLFGGAIASSAILTPLITIHVFGQESFSEIFGTVSAFISLGPVFTPVFSGWMYDITGSYRIPMLVYLCIYVLTYAIGVIILSKKRKS